MNLESGFYGCALLLSADWTRFAGDDGFTGSVSSGLFTILGLLIASGAGVPIPEDLTLLLGGYLSYHGTLPLLGVIVVGALGVWCGDSIMFFAGRTLGTRLADSRWGRFVLPPARRERARSLFGSGGAEASGGGGGSTEKSQRSWGRTFRVLLIARLLPLIRGPVYFSAGTLRISTRTFLLADLTAVLLIVPGVILIAHTFAGTIEEWLQYRYAPPIVVAALVLIAVALAVPGS